MFWAEGYCIFIQISYTLVKHMGLIFMKRSAWGEVKSTVNKFSLSLFISKLHALECEGKLKKKSQMNNLKDKMEYL